MKRYMVMKAGRILYDTVGQRYYIRRGKTWDWGEKGISENCSAYCARYRHTQVIIPTEYLDLLDPLEYLIYLSKRRNNGKE